MNKAFISIPLVVIFSGLILSLGLLSALTSENEVIISSDFSDASKALYYTGAAAREVGIKLSRDKLYMPDTTDPTDRYDIDFSTDTTVAADSCLPANGCATVKVETGATISSPRVVTITGKYKSAVRRVQYDFLYSGYSQLLEINHFELKNLPTATTAVAKDIATTSATLQGWTNPNDSANTKKAWFRYANTTDGENPSVCSDTFSGGISTNPDNTVRYPDPPGNTGAIQAGTDPVGFKIGISGLTRDKSYTYCVIIGTNASPSVPLAYGELLSFRTLP